MADMLDLPNELLVRIVESVRDEDTHSLFSVLLTNRRLYAIAQEILYQHVRFHTSTREEARLSKFLKQDPASHRLVRSFTAASLPEFYDTEDLKEVDLIFRVLRNMPGLSSFSIRLHDHIIACGDYVAIPMDHVLGKFMHALPPTITNLEIDTYGFNTGGEPHPCRCIGDLIPRLRTLRVSLRFVCMDLMRRVQGHHASMSQLRLATISLLGQRRREPRCHPAGGSKSRRPSEFAHQLLEVYKQGNLPHLEHFLLIDCRYYGQLPVEQFGFCKARDIVKQSTTTIPVTKVETKRAGTELHLFFRDFEGRDYIGTKNDLSSFIEGSVSWSTLANGSRMPPNVGSGTNAGAQRSSVHQLGTSGRFNRASSRPPITATVNEKVFQLWEREKLVGTPTLRATRAETLSGEELINEILPPGWELYLKDSGQTFSARRIPPDTAPE